MDKYEYRVKTEQMLEHMEQQSSYKKAMEIADTIDWRQGEESGDAEQLSVRYMNLTENIRRAGMCCL